MKGLLRLSTGRLQRYKAPSLIDSINLQSTAMKKLSRQAALWFAGVTAYKQLLWPISIRPPVQFWCGVALLVSRRVHTCNVAWNLGAA